jgi:hypothetical protein
MAPPKPQPKSRPQHDDPIERVFRAIRSPSVTGLLKTWQGWLILAVVISQLLLPLHYYTTRRDLHDERFAWRMFSPVRMTECSVRATLDSAPLPLEREFHEAWLAIARRGRFVVVEEMGARLCKKYEGKAVIFTLDCKYVGEPPQSYGGYNICNVPLI